MRQILLISSSVVHGFGYLDHAEPEIKDILGSVKRVVFVPFALKDHGAYAAKVRERFKRMGYALDSLHEARRPLEEIERAPAVFVGGGNTFRLLKAMQDRGLLAPLRTRVQDGMPYIGSSAGSNLACPTIRTTNDMPIVEPRGFAGLGLVPFQLNPHFLDPDPHSTHKGETREDRIREFLEENSISVLGLREGSHLLIKGDTVRLCGTKTARFFRRGLDTVELSPGPGLDSLLHAPENTPIEDPPALAEAEDAPKPEEVTIKVPKKAQRKTSLGKNKPPPLAAKSAAKPRPKTKVKPAPAKKPVKRKLRR